MNIALIMLLVYMAATITISIIMTRKARNKDSSSFLAANNSLGIMLIIPLLFSEMIAGAGTIGNAASAYSSGLNAVWANWGMVIGCFLFIIFTLTFYRAMHRKYGVISIPEAYKFLFDEKCRMVLLIVIALVYAILFSLQPTAAAAIIAPLLGVSETLVTWIICAIFILVTIGGGMSGVAWMNVLHAVVMYIGMFIVCFLSIKEAGGIENMQQVLPDSYFSLTGGNTFTTIANALGTGISFLASATVVTVAFASKSLKTARIGTSLAAIIVVPFALFVALIGMAAKVVLPDIAPNTALFSMANSLSGVLGGVAAMAIIAAIWSTGPALLMVVATTLTRDLFLKLKPDADDKKQIRFSRCMLVVVGVAGTAFGMTADSILNQMYGAFQIRSIVGIVLMVAILWPRVTKTAAFWSMLVGGIVAAVWFFAGNPFNIAALWPAAGICIVLLLIISFASKEKESEGHRQYREALQYLREVEEQQKL